MCLAVPAKITKLINNETALCDFNGIEKEVNVSLVDSPREQEWVIVHVGFALNRIDEEEAQKTMEILNALPSEAKA